MCGVSRPRRSQKGETVLETLLINGVSSRPSCDLIFPKKYLTGKDRRDTTYSLKKIVRVQNSELYDYFSYCLGSDDGCVILLFPKK